MAAGKADPCNLESTGQRAVGAKRASVAQGHVAGDRARRAVVAHPLELRKAASAVAGAQPVEAEAQSCFALLPVADRGGEKGGRRHVAFQIAQDRNRPDAGREVDQGLIEHELGLLRRRPLALPARRARPCRERDRLASL